MMMMMMMMMIMMMIWRSLLSPSVLVTPST
jgi:hypothetical protein